MDKKLVVLALVSLLLTSSLIAGLLLRNTSTEQSTQLQCASPELIRNTIIQVYNRVGYIVQDIQVVPSSKQEALCWYNVSAKVSFMNSTYRILLQVPVMGNYILLRSLDVLNNKNVELRIVKVLPVLKLKKVQRPNVTLYIMSLCPHGSRAFEYLYNFYKNNRFFDLHTMFIVNAVNTTDCQDGILFNNTCYVSLHGKEELIIDVVLYNIYKEKGIDVMGKIYTEFLEKLRGVYNRTQVLESFKEVLRKYNLSMEGYEDFSVLPKLYHATVEKGFVVSPTLVLNSEVLPINPAADPNASYGAICASTENPPSICKEYMRYIEVEYE